MAYTNHRTSSAERNTGRKPKLTERDHDTLNRIVSIYQRRTAAKVTAELNIHLQDPVSTKKFQQELHKSNIHGTATTVQPLITDNSAKR